MIPSLGVVFLLYVFICIIMYLFVNDNDACVKRWNNSIYFIILTVVIELVRLNLNGQLYYGSYMLPGGPCYT
jgi:hypothetical protein